ncbi:XRE family transcriptional regulator [Comamonas sp. w2-DMI]|uniref:XRE family transcriptional regulator n=1 Tax=Comamonas sp. w2-DMI TaxID=3126391 RepID=UPI0032E4C4A3
MAALPKTKPSADVVLSKATLNAAAHLGLNNAELAKVLGISEPSVSRLAAGNRLIDPQSREGQTALILIRIFRALDLMVGGDTSARNAWMTSHNRAIGGVPKAAIQTMHGLVHTVDYLDGMKGAA